MEVGLVKNKSPQDTRRETDGYGILFLVPHPPNSLGYHLGHWGVTNPPQELPASGKHTQKDLNILTFYQLKWLTSYQQQSRGKECQRFESSLYSNPASNFTTIKCSPVLERMYRSCNSPQQSRKLLQLPEKDAAQITGQLWEKAETMEGNCTKCVR